MNIEQLDLKVETIIRQRNAFFKLVIILSFSLLLSIIVIFSQSSKTIIIGSNFTPSDKYQITDSRISGRSYDQNYIGDRAIEIATRILNITNSNKDFAIKTLLDDFHPSAYNKIKSSLLKNFKTIENTRITNVFLPIEVIVNQQNLSAVIKGEFQTFLTNVSKSEKRSYQISFVDLGSKLVVREFKRINDDDK